MYCDQGESIRFLVDGQQRFTTLHLIFLHLRLMAKDLGDTKSVDKLAPVITSYGEGRRTRFTIDIEERANALEALYEGSDYSPPLGSSLSLRNLYARSAEIGTLLSSKVQPDTLADFVDWLLGRVVLVAIRAANRDEGYRIFESMNDRGARLTAVDLLKSFLLSNVRRNPAGAALSGQPSASSSRAGAAGKERKRKKGLAASVSRGRSDYALMVRAGVLTPETRLVGTHRKKDYWTTIGEDGQLYFDGSDVSHPNPNEAGSVIKNGASCNGLLFWHIERDGIRIPLRQVRDTAQLNGRLPTRRR